MGATFTLCAATHVPRATGMTANDLASLRAALVNASPETLFHHIVQPVLRAPAARERPADDLSTWLEHVLELPGVAAELRAALHEARRAFAPGTLRPEAARDAALAVLGAHASSRVAAEGRELALLASDGVPLPVAEARTPDELLERLAAADAAVWFWHFVEEPWWRAGAVPAAEWAHGLGADAHAALLAEAASSTRPLDALRREITGRWRRRALAITLADAGDRDAAQRAREAAREAGRWARRLAGRDRP